MELKKEKKRKERKRETMKNERMNEEAREMSRAKHRRGSEIHRGFPSSLLNVSCTFLLSRNRDNKILEINLTREKRMFKCLRKI